MPGAEKESTKVHDGLESQVLPFRPAEPRAQLGALLKREEWTRKHSEGVGCIMSKARTISLVRMEDQRRVDAASRRNNVVLASIRAQVLSAAHTAGPLWDLLPSKLRVRILLTETGVEQGRANDLAARRVLITCKRLFAMAQALSNARQIRLFTRAAPPLPLRADHDNPGEMHEDEARDALGEMHGRGGGAHRCSHAGGGGHAHVHAA
ncbi:hypothetical protein T484DRAFT_1889798, partial [Baffinella frigidus]